MVLGQLLNRAASACSTVEFFFCVPICYCPPLMVGHISAALLMEHLLVFYLVVAVPIVDHFDMARLTAAADANVKIRYYRKTIAWLWICAVLAVVAAGIGAMSAVSLKPGDASWRLGHGWASLLVEALLVAFVALLLLPAAVALWKNWTRKPRKWSSEQVLLKSLGFILPATAEQRRLWVVLCISAGVCEEVLYRGFLLRYLHTFPFSLSLTWAIVLSSIIFAMGHLYQGPAGAIQTAAMGIIFCLMFVLTGNLLIPILVHAVMDLRILLLIRPQDRSYPDAPQSG